MDVFWKTIAEYNSFTWISQIAITLFGVILTILLIRHPTESIKLGMKIFLVAVHLWIAIVYYHIYCAERKYNDVLALYWGIMAAIWLWDTIKGYTTFERGYKHDILAYVLLIIPFIYPVFSIIRGLQFPAITTPVMPCSVAVFSIGLLLLFSKKINMFLVLFLCHWSMIAISKTYFFDIPEDFLLSSASVPALYLFFKEYFAKNLHKETKPKAKYVNLLLIFSCVIIGVLLMVTMFSELGK
jgi:hypothetical protein